MRKIVFVFVLFVGMMILASCGENTNTTQTHNALEHQFNNENIILEATCETDGLKKIVCSCGAYVEEKIVAKGHIFHWEVKQEATCTEEGLEQEVCSCGEVGNSRAIPLLSHDYEWNIKEEATCNSPEVVEGRCSCGDIKEKENDALGHLYGEFYILETASTEKEGLIESICANGCGEDIRLKVMKTPVVTRNVGTLSWNAIDGATGYRLYDNGKLVADLGNVLSYEINLCESDNHSFEVEAYTSNELYYEVSHKSNISTLSVSYGTNMQANLGTDFERFNFNNSLTLTKEEWFHEFANFSDGEVSILNTDKNTYAKLLPISNEGYSEITYASNPEVLKDGTYVLSLDVMLGSAVDGILCVGLFDDITWGINRHTFVNMSKANSTTWTTISYEFEIKNQTGPYANLDIGYQALVSGENNYILVDNINITPKGSNVNLNGQLNSNFEDCFSKILNKTGWNSDGKNGVVYVTEDSIENSFVTIDGNTVFKAYTSKFKTTSVNFKGNKNIAQEGIYLLTIRVKGGPDANRLGSIGIRMFGEGFKVVDVRFDGVENINSEEWITLKLIFIVKKTVATTWVNIETYVYTNNDENSSVDNYVLIDDLSVYKVYLQ